MMFYMLLVMTGCKACRVAGKYTRYVYPGHLKSSSPTRHDIVCVTAHEYANISILLNTGRPWRGRSAPSLYWRHQHDKTATLAMKTTLQCMAHVLLCNIFDVPEDGAMTAKPRHWTQPPEAGSL